jgi:glycosyltransferase involved in cell wall biosynthesis
VLDRDPTSFAQALNRLGADEHLRRSLGETAAMRAHVYTWQRQAATLEAAFLTFCRGA